MYSSACIDAAKDHRRTTQYTAHKCLPEGQKDNSFDAEELGDRSDWGELFARSFVEEHQAVHSKLSFTQTDI